LPEWLVCLIGGIGPIWSDGKRGRVTLECLGAHQDDGIWMPPKLMNEYPHIVVDPKDRHPFEHGRNCFTEWVKHRGLISWEVTWERELTVNHWGADPNGYHRGNQSGLLAGDRMCEPPYYPAT